MYELTIIVIASLAFVWSFSKKKEFVNIGFFFCFILLVFHDGFRWETGTDWVPYYNYFLNCLDIDESDINDVGYVFFNKLIRLFTNEYSVFLILYALIQYAFVLISIRRYSINPFLSLFLYYCMTLPVLGMNRQFLALVICLFSIQYIIERRFLKFVLCMFIAVLFHKSSLIFFVTYFLLKEQKKYIYVIIFAIAVAISILGIVNMIPSELFIILGNSSVDKMDIYADRYIQGDANISLIGTSLAIFKRAMWLILLFALPKFVKQKNNYYYLFVNMYFIASVIYILLNNSILQIIVSRGLLFFNIAEIFIIPYVLTMFKNNLGKCLIFALIIVYGLINMNRGIDSYSAPGEQSDLFYPYKGLLINTEYNRKNH